MSICSIFTYCLRIYSLEYYVLTFIFKFNLITERDILDTNIKKLNKSIVNYPHFYAYLS